MSLFKRKSPEEKEAARIEKMRRTEGERGFGGALMTPVGDLALADIVIVRLDPEQQLLTVNCQKRQFAIPYGALRRMTVSSEAEIAKGESAITAQEMQDLLDGDAGQFVGPMDKNATYRARWFIRIEYQDEYNLDKSIMLIAYSMRGFYMATSKLFAAGQFEENFADILTRFA